MPDTLVMAEQNSHLNQHVVIRHTWRPSCMMPAGGGGILCMVVVCKDGGYGGGGGGMVQ